MLNPLILFGGDKDWHSEDWTASDDSVRGGKSESFLEATDTVGRFYGTLDTSTLGGAGFASQRTTGDDCEWDLSAYAGILLDIAKGDKKRYTFILKDTLLPPQDGREQSTVSWEVDFELPPQTIPGDAKNKTIFFPWDALNPTYRGRVQKDAKPLELTKIKRFSIMMRSFFDAQHGDFSLSITSIKALKTVPKDASIFIEPVHNGTTSKRSEADEKRMEAGLAPRSTDSRHTVATPPRSFYRTTKAVAVGVLVVVAMTFYLGQRMDWF